jgi:hypothetical protein
MANIRSTTVEFKNSSNIHKINYDYDTKDLTVFFKNDTVYKYKEVPSYIFLAFIDPETGSIGSFLSKHVKKKYAFEKVEALNVKVQVAV